MESNANYPDPLFYFYQEYVNASSRHQAMAWEADMAIHRYNESRDQPCSLASGGEPTTGAQTCVLVGLLYSSITNKYSAALVPLYQ